MSARKVAWENENSSLDKFLLSSIGVIYLYPTLLLRNYRKFKKSFSEEVLNPSKLRLWFYSLLLLLSIQYVILFTLSSFVAESLKVVMLSSVLISTLLFVAIFLGIFTYLASKKLYITAWSINKSIFITTKSFTLNLRRLEVESALPNLFLYEAFLKARRIYSNISGQPVGTDFVKNALRLLPKDGYVLLELNKMDGTFIQFFNNGRQILMDIPVYQNNCYSGKYKSIKNILKSYEILRQYKSNSKEEKEYYSLVTDNSSLNKTFSINLNRNYKLAAKLTESISNKIFKIKKPEIYSFNTGEFR